MTFEKRCQIFICKIFCGKAVATSHNERFQIVTQHMKSTHVRFNSGCVSALVLFVKQWYNVFQDTYKDDFHPMNTVQERIINMVRYLNTERNHGGSSGAIWSKRKIDPRIILWLKYKNIFMTLFLYFSSHHTFWHPILTYPN